MIERAPQFQRPFARTVSPAGLPAAFLQPDCTPVIARNTHSAARYLVPKLCLGTPSPKLRVANVHK
jgi:hypothetical protein